jgi:RND family efflux transporter MFP subunit
VIEFHRLAIVGAALSFAACHGTTRASLPASAASVPTVGVRVERPKTEIADELVQVTGKLRAKHEAMLGAPATGTLGRVYVQLGDRVKAGQALARLDTWQLEIGVEQARAAQAMAQAGFDAAKIELQRAKQLRQSDAAPSSALDRANAAFRQASAGLDQAAAALHAAELTLARATLRAPFDAVVTQVYKNVGETVTMMPPTPIVSVVDAGHLEVRVPVPETVVDFITVGTEATGTVSPSGKTFRAKVYSVGAVVDPRTRTVEVAADVEAPADAGMRPGALVEANFSDSLVHQKLPGVYIPAQAVRESDGGTAVLLVVDGRIEERAVKTEDVTPGIVRVREGLTGEEDVVVDGSVALASGTPVRVASDH